MAMYSEPTTENFNNIKQALQEREQKVLELYPYLSQNKILSQKEHENEAIKVMERIKDQQIPNGKFNEILPEENIQEGLTFVNLVNEIYIYIYIYNINKRKRYFKKKINQYNNFNKQRSKYNEQKNNYNKQRRN